MEQDLSRVWEKAICFVFSLWFEKLDVCVRVCCHLKVSLHMENLTSPVLAVLISDDWLKDLCSYVKVLVCHRVLMCYI